MEKYFDINTNGHSIRCKLFSRDPRKAGCVVICCHGFAGSKEGSSIKRLADKLADTRRDAALIAFDWPCHGEDRSPKLTLAACDAYLTDVVAWARAFFGTDELYASANSFGGYLLLRYLSEHESPFRKTVLRCPAIPFHAVIAPLISADAAEKLAKGRAAMIGFDKKIPVTAEFMAEIRENDVTTRDLTAHMDDVLILHGTEDEIVPFGPVQAFADENLIECVPFEKTDHRFQSLTSMGNAIAETLRFFFKS